ncbi:sine oculis-binding protein homolog [Neocloeon triangulifer]|uniref:sine oculis-binding protein homolog n=1 Tax=Neocloeon triangulifer TaxID=2078957 RepID=UPI00286F80A1|nr:sine oculis-binding protein homolog [Neocloeon triangulifer]
MGSRNSNSAPQSKCNAPKSLRLPAALRVGLPGVRKEQQEDEIKKYAETAMNELLGWYGYEKVDSAETQGLQLRHFGPSASLLASQKRAKMQLEGGAPRRLAHTRHRQKSTPAPPESTDSDDEIDPGRVESLPSSLSKDQTSPDFTLCSWCHQTGAHIIDNTSSKDSKDQPQRAFCSEQCFSQCRRANFKRNKVCDWCKHVRHSTNYVDFKDNESQLQFCSEKCLNQCKMSIFCKEAQAHLQSQLVNSDQSAPSSSGNGTLITPELWLKDCKNNSDDDASGFAGAGSDSPKSTISSHSSNRSISPAQQTAPPARKTPSPKISSPAKQKKEKKYKEAAPTQPTATYPMSSVLPDPYAAFPLPPPPRFPEQFCFPSLRPPLPPLLRPPLGLGFGPFAPPARPPFPSVTVMVPFPVPLPIPIPIPIILPLFSLPKTSSPPPAEVATSEVTKSEKEEEPSESCSSHKKPKIT